MDAFDTLPMCPDEFNLRADLAKARSILIAICNDLHVHYAVIHASIHTCHTHMYLYTPGWRGDHGDHGQTSSGR